MALNATVHKIHISIADMDRYYYQDHSLTIAQHPSETEERVMVRILAFALNASEDLQFTKGLCVDDEPDIWVKTLTDDIDTWIEVGLPSEERIRKACARSQKVRIYAYGKTTATPWWDKIQNKLSRFKNLEIFLVVSDDDIDTMFAKNMHLQLSVQEGDLLLSDSQTTQSFSLQQLV